MKTGKIDLFTVVCDRDLGLLQLQANSIKNYVAPAFLNEIFIIYNEIIEKRRMHEIDGIIKNFFAEVQPRIHILFINDIFSQPEIFGGWMRQQSLKLFAAKLSNTEFYMLLDAKNHFIKSVHADFFFRNGRARSFLMSHENMYRTEYDATFQYFSSSDYFEKNKTMPVWTPYLVKRSIAADMIKYHFNDDIDFLCSEMLQNHLTEFLAYAAYLSMRMDPRIIYFFRDPFVQTIWANMVARPGIFEHCINVARQRVDRVCFGIHANALKKLDDDQANILAQFWREHRLVPPDFTADDIHKLIYRHTFPT